MTWFDRLTGFRETSPAVVRENLSVEGSVLRSHANGRSWQFGELEILSLAQLRERAQAVALPATPISVQEVTANVQRLHQEETNAGALFQVASQFNLLEMVSPRVTPDDGIGGYEGDFTQGPSCAIAAGAGTIYRNYFVPVKGQIGQSADNQIDCLAGLGQLLGNSDGHLWEMVNGYALASAKGLTEIAQKLSSSDPLELDHFRQALQIGVQWDTQVTLECASHTVSQAYCSALPVAYTRHDPELWAPFAQLVLEAAYEATLCAAIINASRTGNKQVFLTLLGGGAFGNEPDWIFGAIRRALENYADCGLEVIVVSYSRSIPLVQELVREFN